MPSRRRHQYTLYDRMEENGYFDSNPGNPLARDATNKDISEWPVQYPKMFYHPEGKEVVTMPAEPIATPFGPKLVGEQRALISKVAENEIEAKALLADGWHETPAKAVAARQVSLKNVPAAESDELELISLREENAKLKALAAGAPSTGKAPKALDQRPV